MRGAPDKANAELGFEARVALREGLELTVGWTRENLDWIERCVARHQAVLAEARVLSER